MCEGASAYVAIRWPHDLRVLQLDGHTNVVDIELLFTGVSLVHLCIVPDLAHIPCGTTARTQHRFSPGYKCSL